MGMEAHVSSCYCCVKPSTSRSSNMDIDAALNELGMLSTVTTIRQEFLRERAARDRNLSEPGLGYSLHENIYDNSSMASSIIIPAPPNAAAIPPCAPTPANSPSRPGASSGGYQIICINPQFVTGVSASGASNPNTLSPILAYSQPNSLTSAAAAVVATSTRREPEDIQLQVIEFGAKYSQDALETDARASRIARSKTTRLKRFKKPYSIPWKHQADSCFFSAVSSDHGAYLSPNSACGSTEGACNSNASTPEKVISSNGAARNGHGCTVTRSKSLDELDFNKLYLAEAENHNLVLQRKEIESMAENMQNLQVNE